MKREKKPPEKCKTCPYALGFINTLVDPCPKCEGKTSIFGVQPTTSGFEKNLELQQIQMKE